MAEDQKFYVFFGHKVAKNLTFEANILHTSKHAMSMWSNTDVKPVKQFLESDQSP